MKPTLSFPALAALLFATAAVALPPWHGPHTAAAAAAPTPRQVAANDGAPSPTCTIIVPGPSIINILAETCTDYSETVTATRYTDCAGCALSTRRLGHPPVVACTTRVTLPVATTTEVACAPSGY